MSTNNRKRKQRQHQRDEGSSRADVPLHRELETPNPLYIQAHEADIIRGPQAKDIAASLEVVEYRLDGSTCTKVGAALIPIGGDFSGSAFGQEDELFPAPKQDERLSTWVDRYDARLLLDGVLPQPPAALAPSSPTGWSDLSSDAEDTFFFSPDEADDFRREKRRKQLEQAREERLKARLEEDGEDAAVDDDVWGGSDEEPEESNKELMQRTAAHILSSPNPAQLEMRILANHGGDRRFAFLRGRWRRAWNLAKAKARIKLKEEVAVQPAGLTGVLAGYGSDDSENGDAPSKDVDDEEALKEARRKRLKEWKEKRLLV